MPATRGCTEGLCQGSLGSSCPDPMPPGPPFRKGGFTVFPAVWTPLSAAGSVFTRLSFKGWDPWFKSPFPPYHFQGFFKHGGEERPQCASVPRECVLGRPAVEFSGSIRAKEVSPALLGWSVPTGRTDHAVPEPGACSEGKAAGARQEGDKFQQLVGTSSCFMELLPAAFES